MSEIPYPELRGDPGPVATDIRFLESYRSEP
jgi:hypothetical protein